MSTGNVKNHEQSFPRRGKSKRRHRLTATAYGRLRSSFIAREKIYHAPQTPGKRGRISRSEINEAVSELETRDRITFPKPLPTNAALHNFLDSTTLVVETPTLEFLCLLLFKESFDSWSAKLPAHDMPQSAWHEEGTSWSDPGLIKPYLSPPAKNLVRLILSRSRTQVWIFGNTLEHSLEQPRTAYLDALYRGIKIHFLILDPTDGIRLSVLARELNVDEDDAMAAADQTMVRLVRLMTDWYQAAGDNFSPDQISVRLTGNPIKMRSFIADPDNHTAKSFFVPSVNRKKSIQLPAFECRNTSDGIMSIYFDGLLKEWDEATPFRTFLNREASQRYRRKFQIFDAYYGYENDEDDEDDSNPQSA